MYCCAGTRRLRNPPCRRPDSRSKRMANKMTFLLAPVAAAVLAACAVGPNYHAPETRTAERFDGIETTYSTDAQKSEPAIAGFWRTFADPTLERLVDEAL